MTARPYAATIKVQCTVVRCHCEHSQPAKVYNSGGEGEIIERELPRRCPECGHLTIRHATAEVTKLHPIERRARPR